MVLRVLDQQHLRCIRLEMHHLSSREGLPLFHKQIGEDVKDHGTLPEENTCRQIIQCS